MADLSLQDVTTLFEANERRSKERHDELKEEVQKGFTELGRRVKVLESAEKPLITFRHAKWVAGIAAAAFITAGIGALF